MGQSPALCQPTRDVDGEAEKVPLQRIQGGSSSTLCSNNTLCGGQEAEILSLEHEQVHIPVEHMGASGPQEGSGIVPRRIDLARQGSLGIRAGAEHTGAGALSRTRLLQPHLRHRFSDYYEIGKKLGEGSFGDVYEARLRPVDRMTGKPQRKPREPAAAPGASGKVTASRGGRKVAVKIFSVHKEPKDLPPAQAYEELKRWHSFETERGMLATLEHPHIVRMYECFQEASRLYIVMEICRGGELYGRIINRSRQVGGGGLDEPNAAELFRQMLQAVGYLHSRRIVHRDIKTENFLLVGEKGAPNGEVLKLCDFGTAALLTKEQPRCMENIGTLSYTAPEIYANCGATVAADAWSLGVVLYVIITGTNPFRVPGKTAREDTIKRIRSGQFDTKRLAWIQISALGKDLVSRLLVLEEKRRYTCLQALKHQWLASKERPMSIIGLADPPGLAQHVPRLLTLLLRLPRLAEAQRLALVACATAATESDVSMPAVPWRDLFLALDEDQDGRLIYPEFVAGMKRLLGPLGANIPDERLEECALALDLDSSGTVEWVEFLAVAVLGSGAASEAPEPMGTAFRLLASLPQGAGSDVQVEPSQIILDFVPGNLRELTATASPETTADTTSPPSVSASAAPDSAGGCAASGGGSGAEAPPGEAARADGTVPPGSNSLGEASASVPGGDAAGGGTAASGHAAARSGSKKRKGGRPAAKMSLADFRYVLHSAEPFEML